VPLVSYAQNFEDVMLWRALGHVEKGFYIDVGAQHPVVDSVSRAFYERGWRGIHVEPTSAFASLLREDRPDEIVIQAAVNNSAAPLTFYEIPGTGISTGDTAIAQGHRERGFEVHEVVVPCVTLRDLFKQAGTRDIHWLKVDVEGMERQVLESWGKSATRPWIVAVESTLPLTQVESHGAWEAILLERGYALVHFDGLNRFYVSKAHPELRAAFAVPPNVFDDFALNGTANAPFHRLLKSRLEAELSEKATQLEQQKAAAGTEVERLLKREQEATAQLGLLQRTSAEEQSRLAVTHASELRAMQDEFVARERSVVQQVHATQQELARLREEGAAQQRVLEAQHAQARQEIEQLLRTLAQREKEAGAQLVVLQRQADQQRIEQSRAHDQHARALQAEFAAREQRLAQQVDEVHKELRQVQQASLERERALNDQVVQARQQTEGLLQRLARREQEVVAQLQAIQRQAGEDKAALVRTHAEQVRVLQTGHAEREQALVLQLAASRQELLVIRKQSAAHENQNRQRVEQLLLAAANREKEFGAKLHELQQEGEAQRGEQARILGEQAKAVQDGHAVREQALMQQVNATELERTRLVAALLAQQSVGDRLQNELNEAKLALATTERAITWRMTAPLRSIAALFAGNRVPSPSQELPRAAPLAAGPVIARSIEELLALPDAQFVDSAYRTLLGRAPDPHGLRHYMGRLQAGYPRWRVVAQLRLSPEAMSRAAHLPGLDALVRRERRRRFPVVGILFRILSRMERQRPQPASWPAEAAQMPSYRGGSATMAPSSTVKAENSPPATPVETAAPVHPPSDPPVIEPQFAPQPMPIRMEPKPVDVSRLSPAARDIFRRLESAAASHGSRT
jgi:FkbM family methyltransferase